MDARGFPVDLGSFRTEGPVEIVLWEFGAATIVYSVPIDARLEELVPLSDLLWDHAELMKDASKTYEPVTYEGAGHGFMRAGEASDASAANKKGRADAWKRWKELLAKI